MDERSRQSPRNASLGESGRLIISHVNYVNVADRNGEI